MIYLLVSNFRLKSLTKKGVTIINTNTSEETKAKMKAALTSFAKSHNMSKDDCIKTLIEMLPDITEAQMRDRGYTDVEMAYIADQLNKGVSFEDAIKEIGDSDIPYADKPAFKEALHALELTAKTRQRHYSKLSPMAKMYFLALLGGDEYDEINQYWNPLRYFMEPGEFDRRVAAIREDLRIPPIEECKSSRKGLTDNLNIEVKLQSIKAGVSNEDYEILRDACYKDAVKFAQVLSKYDRSVYDGDPLVNCFKMIAFNVLPAKGILYIAKTYPTQSLHLSMPKAFGGRDLVHSDQVIAATPTLKCKVTTWLKGTGYKYFMEIKDKSIADDLNNQLNEIIKSEVMEEELATISRFMKDNPFAMHL